ncbi:Hint domain-containing protein [Tautonia plasticadhaerens]|uniref:Replicative DNA helicase n=1 Tax=Tautonia plasticadhaerens TaxID=2527974 RepID=A0A518H973_9BACT|nr:Hint domain-containing protein [Tautonia plasticadhaerens]QDV37407.1 replicative DNA helicase [Tautonia plasticadhaerens]
MTDSAPIDDPVIVAFSGFDALTEVLTWGGWKPIAAVVPDDLVCSLVDGRVVYQRPLALHRRPYRGRLYRIRAQQLDLLVAPGHPLYVRTRYHESHSLLPARAAFGRRVRYQKAGRWVGRSDDAVVLPPLRVVAGQHGHGQRTIPELRLPIRLYMMLLGAFISEGNTFGGHNGYGIDIHQVKPHGKARFERDLRPALLAAGFNCSSGSTNRYHIHSKQLYVHLRPLGVASEKHIPPEIFAHSREQLAVLFDWLMWGDGHSEGGRPINYTSTSARLVDDVQRLCLHIGIAANAVVHQPAGLRYARGGLFDCRECYQARIVSTKTEPEANHGHVKEQSAQEERWEDDYDGELLGLTVPGHVIYVRRDGKPVWCGDGGWPTDAGGVPPRA